MDSKELNEILNKTRRTLDISLTPKQVKELVKDLEILEILKEYIFFGGTLKYDWRKKELILKDIELDSKYDKEIFKELEIIKQWLEGDELDK